MIFLLLFPLFRITDLSLSPFFFSRESVSIFTYVLHTMCSRKYKIYGCRYCEICGRCGARPKAGRFQVEIAFWRLIDSWLLESEWYYYGEEVWDEAALVAPSEVA